MRQYIVISPQWLYRYDEIFTPEVISHADFKYDVRIDALNLPSRQRLNLSISPPLVQVVKSFFTE